MSVITETSVTISAQHGHSRCLLCGERNPWSLKLVFQADHDGAVRTSFDSHRGLQGYDEILHGGVIAALLDAAMTHCLFHRGVQAVTGDLHVRFVQSIPCDASLDIRSWVLSSHPPLYHLKAEIVHEKQLMAWAESTFMQRKAHP